MPPSTYSSSPPTDCLAAQTSDSEPVISIVPAGRPDAPGNLAFDFENLSRSIFYDQYKRIDSYFAGTELASISGHTESLLMLGQGASAERREESLAALHREQAVVPHAVTPLYVRRPDVEVVRERRARTP